MEIPVKAKKTQAKAGKSLAPVAPASPAVPGLRDEIARIHGEIDRVFENMFGGWRWPTWPRPFALEPFERPAWPGGMVSPTVDFGETDDDYKITAELPGLSDKDIDLVLSEGMLTLKGEKSEQREEKERDYHLSERRFGSFSRSFRVPEGVDQDKIEAKFDKGVLTVVLPKSAEAKKKRRKIKVK